MWPALEIFMAAATQWRMSEVGATGLYYEALPMLFKVHKVRKKDRANMLNDIKICERAALDTWSKNRGR